MADPLDMLIDQVKSIATQVTDMNTRGQDNAQTQVRIEEKVSNIEKNLDKIGEMAHPKGCLTDRLVHAEEVADEARKIAESAQKTADSARRTVTNFKVGKGMTPREKWALTGIGASILAAVKFLADVFGK